MTLELRKDGIIKLLKYEANTEKACIRVLNSLTINSISIKTDVGSYEVNSEQLRELLEDTNNIYDVKFMLGEATLIVDFYNATIRVLSEDREIAYDTLSVVEF